MKNPNENESVRGLFEQAGRPVCPEPVVDRILAAADAEDRRRRQAHSRTPRPWAARVGWAAAAVAALLLVLVLPDRLRLDPEPETLSAAEYEATRAEVELAFAVIGEAMRSSSSIVDDQLRNNVAGQVFRTVRRGIAPEVEDPAPPATTPSPDGGDDNRQSRLSLPPRGDC